MENQQIRNHAEILRDEMVMKDKIIGLLRDEAKTIPEIAEVLKCPEHEATFWVMAMWRYGTLKEAGKANSEGYYSYTLKEAIK